ncbi:Protein FAR1-RELATED SEQUENCE 5 [Abeliophyllum distichum]|uniref:Protein FAR1-RELATED SEQUENCE 5 n=1 Tax=Abeliophyllum distichum TaxID=126358 RepID=A0ABD1RFN5_9LAMI
MALWLSSFAAHLMKGNNNLYHDDETVNMNYGVVDDNNFGESDNEPVGENENILDDEKLGEDSAIVPKVGMKFKDDKEVFEFYKRLYRCNRQVSAHVKRKLECNDIAGVPLYKSFNSAVVEAGGYDMMTCVEKDCRNYIEKVRWLRLGEGDTAAVQAYFSKMQTLCPGFYFSMDLDEEGRLKNVFWADSRCREAYKEFGDVVTFDTTNLTNKYDMSFAPFVGVNHHGQSTLLGCGLVSNEDTGHLFGYLGHGLNV